MFDGCQTFFSDGILDQKFGGTTILYFQGQTHKFLLNDGRGGVSCLGSWELEFRDSSLSVLAA